MAIDSGGFGMSTGISKHRIARQKNETLVEVCSVRVGKRCSAYPSQHILEIVGSARPQPVPLAPGFVGGLVHYRGDVLTTVSLRQLLELPPRDGKQDILVLESEGGCFGLQVDSVGEVLTVSASTTSPIPRFSTSAAARCWPALTSSKTACSSCSIPSGSTPQAQLTLRGLNAGDLLLSAPEARLRRP
jgi:chemotaxis signal transduction protein